MNKLSFNRSIRGIGLIELCIFIIAVGIILAVGIPLYHTYEVNKHSDVTNANIAQVQQALDAFYLKNGYFPKPSSITTKADAANFGIATVGTPPIDRGAVPTRTLGLPDSAGFDGWSHHLVYAVTAIYTAPGQNNLMSGQIHVVDSTGASATQGLLVYAVVAANPDGSGAYDLQGKMVRTCAQATTPLAAKVCAVTTSAVAGTVGMPYISTTLQAGQGTKLVQNAVAFAGDYCAAGAPTSAGCKTQYTAYPAGAPVPSSSVTSLSQLCGPGSSSSFVPLPAGAAVTSPSPNPQWSWVCNGVCQGGNKACNVSLCQPVDAICRTPLPTPTAPTALTGCTSAVPGVYGNFVSGVTANGTAASGGSWEWQCLGNCLTNPDTEQLTVPASPTACSDNPACIGASTPAPPPCSSYICAKVEGTCGPDDKGSFTSAPSGAGLCANGSIPSGVAGAGTGTYTWSCNPTCQGTSCGSNPGACMGTTRVSCSATCTSNGACTAANVACGTSCTDNCGKTFTGAACAPPVPSCSDPGVMTGVNDLGQPVMYVSVSTFIGYAGPPPWYGISDNALSYSNAGPTANSWVYTSCANTDHNGFCPTNSGNGWCPYLAVLCSDVKTAQYMLSPNGVMPKCAGP